MKVLIVLPTYNERGNVQVLIPELFKEFSDVHVLVVDDNSPDKTSGLVRELQSHYKNLHLLERKLKEGLGRAYVAGFQWALKNNFDIIAQMDADFSHRLVDLKKMFEAFEPTVHFVVGSRWVRGGAVRNWNWWRWLLSKFGNAYVQFVLGTKIKDWTGGFNLWRSSVLEKLEMSTLESQGYSFQIEMKFRALRLNFSGREVPIIFEERRQGHSKMSLLIIFEALIRVWRLKSKF